MGEDTNHKNLLSKLDLQCNLLDQFSHNCSKAKETLCDNISNGTK